MKIDDIKKNNEKFIEEYEGIKNRFIKYKEQLEKLKKEIEEKN